MDRKILDKVEEIHYSLENMRSTAFVISESMERSAYDCSFYEGAVSLLAEALQQTEDKIEKLILRVNEPEKTN